MHVDSPGIHPSGWASGPLRRDSIIQPDGEDFRPPSQIRMIVVDLTSRSFRIEVFLFQGRSGSHLTSAERFSSVDSQLLATFRSQRSVFVTTNNHVTGELKWPPEE